MRLEQQVVSLELAQKLKALGVKQESLFYWVKMDSGNFCLMRAEVAPYDKDNVFSAFTVAELGKMLPKRLQAKWKQKDTTGLGGSWETGCNTNLELEYEEKTKKWVVKYAFVATTRADTEADARALILIYLIENKLITL